LSDYKKISGLDPSTVNKIVDASKVDVMANFEYQMKESQRRNQELLDSVAEANARRSQALLDTADNTSRTAGDVAEIRDALAKASQDQHLLIERQQEIIDLQKKQLEMLGKIFVKGTEQASLQEEVMNIMLEQASKEPEKQNKIREFFADKGGDIGVTALLAATKIALKAKGFTIP
jgi:hypothetical protein